MQQEQQTTLITAECSQRNSRVEVGLFTSAYPLLPPAISAGRKRYTLFHPKHMKTNITSKFVSYLYSNFAGNFLGFVIGMASTKLVANFFTTRSIKNLWGLTAKKTVVDKQTFHAFEWMIAIIIGFIVFEIISKWIKMKVDALLPKYRATRWMVGTGEEADVGQISD